MDAIKSRTGSGVEVEIIPRLTGGGKPAVRLTFAHPQKGSLWVETADFREFIPGRDPRIGAVGLACQAGSGKPVAQVCVQVPREDFDRGMALARELAEAEARDAAERRAADAAAARSACPEGFVACWQKWANGDLMSALYVAEDGTEVLASDLLESHGGWYWLPAADVEAARAKARAEADDKAARDREQSEAVAEARDHAAQTGSPVELGRWMDECDGSAGGECSADLCVQVVLPDGSVKVERTHTY